MSKIIKKYNETTGVWEPILTPDVSITQVLENGDNISDTNVVVTNENYSSDDLENPTTLDETLTVISDDISKLQRNVSWLAKHGTGGGGGGGGLNVSYGFEVTYKKGNETLPLEKGQSIYTESNQLSVTFVITGGTAGDPCTYTYTYGGKTFSGEIGVDEPKTFVVEFDKSATVRITGKNPYNSSISPFNFTVYKSALSIRFNASAAGGSYDPGSNLFLIGMGATKATIPILVTNGLGQGSTVEYTLASLDDDGKKVVFPAEPCNTDTEYASGTVDLWQLPGIQKRPGNPFSISISAVAMIGNVKTPASEFNLRVRIINPTDLNLTMSINGQFDPKNPLDVELDTAINVAFKAYGPNTVKKVYYSGKITTQNGESQKIYGAYFDEDLKDSPDSNIADNPSGQKDTTILPEGSFSLREGMFSEDDIVTFTIRAWSMSDFSMVAEVSQEIRAIAMKGYFPRQYGKRRNEAGENKDVMFASWVASDQGTTDKLLWYSNVYGYAPIDDTIDSEDVSIPAMVMNGNGYSGILSDPARMRLQNNAYLKINIPAQYDFELDAMSAGANESYSNYNGYTISFTFAADDTPLLDRVAFLWGENMSDGVKLARGIKITNSSIYWNVSDDTALECKISGGEKHTVDFVFDRRGNYELIDKEAADTEQNRRYYSLAKIYINGILNQAKKVEGTINRYKNDIYIGTNYHNGTTGNTCDMSIYEFCIYTNMLSDTQLVVNGKNARVENRQAELPEYNEWKVKNLLFLNDATKDVYSMFDNESFDIDYITGQIAPNSNIPTLAISFNSESASEVKGFTEEYFYGTYNDASQIIPYNTSYSFYYDPSTHGTIDNVNWKVELQGTSTLSYRVKNLEIYTTGTWVDENNRGPNEDGSWPTLFQPREDWFPEKQFTLKADVVDSAHANNTVIGQWVNNSNTCPILEKTPPMMQLENNRPKDTDENGVQLKNEYNEDAINTDVTIKHTTEGFPILLFISFAGKSDYIFAGIYSFNLGRFSYYNLGLSFLESFTRYKTREDMTTSSCPRIIERYKETRKLGNINVENIYSYEFDNLGSDPNPECPVWTQYPVPGDYKLLDAYGKFRYGDVTDEIKRNLSSLMEVIAKCPVPYASSIYGDGVDKILYNHILDEDGNIVSTLGPISLDSALYTQVKTKLHLKNAVGYFVIANAFGMTDSLGKNMTLRTWGNGLWYPCFYDMDTALGLDNVGNESISTNCAIDYVYYSDQSGVQFRYHSDAIYTDPETGEEVDKDFPGKITSYSPPYAAYKSKLWALLRETSFMYENTDNELFTDKDVFASPYIRQWSTLRNSSLSRVEMFSDIVSNKVGQCGELVYDRDYDSKYIKDSTTTKFLHGTRVEYIKKWLRDHIYFLDGLFDIKGLSTEYQKYDGIQDSPYYKDAFLFKGFNKPSGGPFAVTVASTIPTFISIGTQNSPVKYYISEAGKDTVFMVNASTNASTRVDIYGSSLLTKIEGIGNVFEGFIDSSSEDCLKSLIEFNTTSAKLSNGAFDNFGSYVDVDHGGQVETINISNSKFDASNEQLNLGGLTKVLRINVSRTNLSSLILPNSSLDYLNVSNSGIGTLALEGQNKLASISIDGCSALTRFEVVNCEKIQNLNVSSKENLHGVRFGENATLTSITIDDCKTLTGITIYSNQSLESITINNCEQLKTIDIYNNKNLKKIAITSCKNTSEGVSISIRDSKLEEIEISDVVLNGPIGLPSKPNMSNVKSFRLRTCLRFRGVKYDGSEVEMYDDGSGVDEQMRFVFDLSPMTSLNKRGSASETSLTIYNTDVRYIRVRNEEDNPLRLYSNTFEQSKNIVRIFGHIEIMRGFSFANYNNFYVNNDSSFVPTTYPSDFSFDTIVSGEYRDMLSQCVYLYENSKPAFVNDEHYTNVSFDGNVNTLSEMFANTKCDIHDAYYILQLCNENITSLHGTFQGCKNLTIGETEWIDINAFAKCTNVKDIDYLFFGCNIDCVVIPNPFEPIVGNITKFNYVFSGNYALLTVGECFFPANNKITEIMGFNPKAVGGGYFDDSSLLSTLDKLVTIEDCFNKCSIDFTRETYDATELFKYNVSLENIRNSFRKIGGVGSIKNIFGGESEDASLYPRKLKNVSNSFTFEGDCSHQGEMFDGDTNTDGILMPIGNKLFRSVPDLEYVTGSMYGGNRTNHDYHTEYGETDSFTGPGLLKYIDNIPVTDGDVYRTTPDCNDDGFPHEILKGLTKLKEATAIFDGVKNFKGYDSNNGTPDLNVNILEYNGESMFKDCRSLQNISKFFRNMDPSIVCSLSGKAFKNCDLVNIDQLFSGTKLTGSIPFGLFYQSTTNDRGNGETYEIEKQTIETMANVFEGIKSFTGFTNYTASYQDIVMDNPEYSSDAEPGTKNSFKKIWNLYAYDGTASVDFRALMERAATEYGSDLYADENTFEEYLQHTDDNWQAFDLSLMGKATGYNFNNDRYASMFTKPNYFCPPDIFKYCKNWDDLNINRSLTKVSGPFMEGSFYGLYGRIPEMIFSPLTSIVRANEVFSENESLFPYSWYRELNGTPIKGIIYPPTLFDGLTLQEVNGMFSTTRVWPEATVPSEFFVPISSTLRSINDFWSTANWVEKYKSGADSQLPDNLFDECKNLISVNGMLGQSQSNSIAVINDVLFKKANNNRIKSCRSFLINAPATHGSLPPFWTFDNLPPQNSTGDVLGAFAGCESSGNFNNIDELLGLYGGQTDVNPYLRTIE